MQGSAWARNAGRMWLLGKARRSGKASFAPQLGQAANDAVVSQAFSSARSGRIISRAI